MLCVASKREETMLDDCLECSLGWWLRATDSMASCRLQLLNRFTHNSMSAGLLVGPDLSGKASDLCLWPSIA